MQVEDFRKHLLPLKMQALFALKQWLLYVIEDTLCLLDSKMIPKKIDIMTDDVTQLPAMM